MDFDGVLCDSLEECFRSSWMAATGLPVGPSVPPEPPFDAAYRARFDACRPFIRSGEDYLVVHEWAASGKVPGNQGEFDASLLAKGPGVLADFKARIYAVREQMLEHHRDLWLSWNPLYPGIDRVLAAQADNPGVWILSTKKAEFIGEILRYHGVPWPLDRTVYTGPRKKLDLIADLAGSETSWLIDDQIDHLDFDHPTCRCFLALWGYVSPGAGDRAPAALTLTQALERISSFPRNPRQAG
jgi:hypothetical protein